MWPVLFKIGPLTVHSWGVLLMLGFLLAAWRAARSARRYGIAGEHLWDVSLWGLLGGVVGARIAYVLITPAAFRDNPVSALYLWTGGMTFYGGLIGGILAGAVVCRLRGLSIPDVADLAAVSFPIGYGIGRIGCFLNGCCYGGVCDPPLGMRFHTAEGLTPPSHPAQLYSAAAGLLMYLILVFLFERRRHFPGQVMLVFLMLYGVYRFLVEFVREGATAEKTALLGMTEGQIASLLLTLGAVVAWAIASRRVGRPQPGGDAAGKKKVRPSPAA